MIRRPFLIALLLPCLAVAAPRMATLAVGDCHDGDLLSLSRALALALAQRRGPEHLVSDDAVRARVGLPEAASPEELRLRLNGIQTLFYNGALNRADEQLDGLLKEISRLAPGPERVALFQEAHVLRAMTLRNLDRLALADEELKAVLRLDKAFTLDPDNYAPGLRARLEKLRRELGPTALLRITSEPPGARVFLDGRELGKTPFQSDLPLAAYDLNLTLNGRPSFPRTVRLEKAEPVSLRIDMGFESSLDTRSFACMLEASAAEPRVGNAIKLATLLEVEELVLVRLERPSTGSRWFTASLMNVQSAQRIREGGVQVKREPLARTGALDELATFISTGNLGPQVTALRLPPPGSPLPLALGRGDPTPRTWKTPVGIAAAGVAGAAAAAGVVLTLRSAASWSQFNQYYPTPEQAPTQAQLPQVAAIRRAAESQRTWAIVAFSGAAAAAVTSAVLLAIDGREPAISAAGIQLQPVISPWGVGLVATYP